VEYVEYYVNTSYWLLSQFRTCNGIKNFIVKRQKSES
jgi:hypothetical protein